MQIKADMARTNAMFMKMKSLVFLMEELGTGAFLLGGQSGKQLAERIILVAPNLANDTIFIAGNIPGPQKEQSFLKRDLWTKSPEARQIKSQGTRAADLLLISQGWFHHVLWQTMVKPRVMGVKKVKLLTWQSGMEFSVGMVDMVNAKKNHKRVLSPKKYILDMLRGSKPRVHSGECEKRL